MNPAPTEIEVSLPAMLRDSIKAPKHLRVAAATLDEALHNLFEHHPLLRVHVYDDQGRQRPHVLLYYNDDNVAWLDPLTTPLRPGDTLSVLQAVSGG